MFVKGCFGELVNVSLATSMGVSEYPVGTNTHSVLCIFDDDNSYVLFAGTKDECKKYMAELEKELAAFGKLVRVEVTNSDPEAFHDLLPCTCGIGKDQEPPQHNEECPFYCPF